MLQDRNWISNNMCLLLIVFYNFMLEIVFHWQFLTLLNWKSNVVFYLIGLNLFVFSLDSGINEYVHDFLCGDLTLHGCYIRFYTERPGCLLRLAHLYTRLLCLFVCLFVCLLVLNATFNNISVISWRSVLLVEETGVPEEYHLYVTNDW